jgi:hypothetical protein
MRVRANHAKKARAYHGRACRRYVDGVGMVIFRTYRPASSKTNAYDVVERALG